MKYSLQFLLVLFTLQGLNVYSYDQFDIEDALYRIERHIKLIDDFNKNNKKLQKTVLTKAVSCAESNCAHELVKLCMKKISVDLCFDPVVDTWRLFKGSFSSIDRELFVHEFSSMLVVVYQHCIMFLSENKGGKMQELQPAAQPTVTMADIILLYNRISALPIVQILNSLDQLYVSLQTLMAQYGISADTNWSVWIKNNWWVPPVVIGTLIYSITQRKKMIDLMGFREKKGEGLVGQTILHGSAHTNSI